MALAFSIDEVEDACAARVTRISGVPFRLGPKAPVPTFRRSVVPLSALEGSALEQHLLFTCVLEEVFANDDGQSEAEGVITSLGELRVQWVTTIRPGAPNDDYKLAGREATAIAGSMLALFSDDIVIRPTLVFKPVQQTNSFMLVEQRHRVLFDLSIHS